MSSHRAFVTTLLAVLTVACKHSDMPEQGVSTYYDSTLGGVEPGTAPDAGAETPEAPEPTDETPPASAAFTAGPGGVPLPGDAEPSKTMGKVGNNMFVFEVPRGKDAVVAELRANLTADGWTVDKEEVSPGYGAVRLDISKDGASVNTRVTGDDTRSGIIITVK